MLEISKMQKLLGEKSSHTDRREIEEIRLMYENEV